VSLLIALDDTDMPGTPGTGRLARAIADLFSERYRVAGVTRHQLLVDPAIPYTSHNSSAVIHVRAGADALDELAEIARELVLDSFAQGSDPGLAAVDADAVPAAVIAFGQDAKRCVLTQVQALGLARNTGLVLEPLGGTGGGVIGALAGIGLAATGSDGRFLAFGSIRAIGPEATVEEALAAGIDAVVTPDGRAVTAGRLLCDHGKGPKPAVVQGRPVLFVEACEDGWRALRRD
jgi:tRNA(Ile2) C34 agmatinyltransferase TiaS